MFTAAFRQPRLGPQNRMREYVDFLGGQSPYDALDSADLADLAHLVEVEYFTAGSTIVTAGEPPLSSLTVAR